MQDLEPKNRAELRFSPKEAVSPNWGRNKEIVGNLRRAFQLRDEMPGIQAKPTLTGGFVVKFSHDELVQPESLLRGTGMRSTPEASDWAGWRCGNGYSGALDGRCQTMP